MSKPDHDPSPDAEPQWNDRPARPDPSEEVVERAFGKPPRPNAEEDLARHSVFDEPDILPGRKPETIMRDWSCSRCGYNLRGLPTGHPCPECGHVELYRPPPLGAASFSALYRGKQAAVSPRQSWATAILAGLVVTPLAIPAALFMLVPNPIITLAMAPPAEEVVKLAGVMLLVDTRPFLVKRAAQIWTAALVAALAFSLVHGVLTLAWASRTPGLAMVLTRLIVFPLLHAACTLIATAGIVAAWRKADTEARMPRLSSDLQPLATAIILHVGLNALLFFWIGKGYAF